MSDQPKLGAVPSIHAGRDAVHVAILPVLAGETLTPGVRVRVVSRDGELWASWSARPDGIVDPFLPPGAEIPRGSPVYVCLFPNSVTSLRHVWTATNIPEEKT
jgi:hypothetical protein